MGSASWRSAVIDGQIKLEIEFCVWLNFTDFSMNYLCGGLKKEA